MCARSNFLNTKHFETFHGGFQVTFSNIDLKEMYQPRKLSPPSNSKEGFTTTLVTTQELSRSLLFCNKSKTRDKTFSTRAALVTFQVYNCLHNLLYLHDKNTAKTKIYVRTFLLFSKEHFCEKK